MEMAISLHDAEVRRRQSADTKAALYLAFLAAVIPVIGALSPTVSDSFRNPVLAIDVVLFAIVLVYVLMAGWYAARATAPSVVNSIGEADLSDVFSEKDIRAATAIKLIDATRLNYPLNNKKITYVRLTQAHIFRAFLAIMLIVAVDWGGDVAAAIFEEAQGTGSVPEKSVCFVTELTSSSGSGALRYRLAEVDYARPCLPLSMGADDNE
ncbi:hypothetical protein [Salipiger pallidus]|nr:hypothetical protein [Salipiger pallidus]